MSQYDRVDRLFQFHDLVRKTGATNIINLDVVLGEIAKELGIKLKLAEPKSYTTVEDWEKAGVKIQYITKENPSIVSSSTFDSPISYDISVGTMGSGAGDTSSGANDVIYFQPPKLDF